jgi:hypothetical protein
MVSMTEASCVSRASREVVSYRYMIHMFISLFVQSHPRRINRSVEKSSGHLPVLLTVVDAAPWKMYSTSTVMRTALGPARSVNRSYEYIHTDSSASSRTYVGLCRKYVHTALDTRHVPYSYQYRTLHHRSFLATRHQRRNK